MPRAIDEGQLRTYFQPKADLASGMVLGVEALVRWQHPQRGLLAPDGFIPIAEQSGLIRDLTIRSGPSGSARISERSGSS